MSNNKEYYDVRDRVWIHLGEQSLVEGRVVEIIDLEHLDEGHSRDREFYIIELQTPIEPVYEVREFSQISPDADGPIALYRNLKDVTSANRLLKKVGVKLPANAAVSSDNGAESNSNEKTHKKRRYYSKKKFRH